MNEFTGEYETERADSLRATLPRGRAMLVHASLVLFALCILARSVQLQLVDRGRWTRAAESQQCNLARQRSIQRR